MNLQHKMPTTADEFLRWNEGREGKREFVRGKVVELMINVTRNHWRLATQLTQQLIARLGMEDYGIGSADFGVRTADGIRFPDVMVEPFDTNGKALASSAPLLIAEILSPSTMADDFGQKARDYLSLPTLRHYLVVAQDEMRVWVWSRRDGQWAGPEQFTDISEPVPLGGFGITLDVASLYAGVVRPNSAS